MGCYINPSEMTKEKWLEKYGQVTVTPAWPAPEGTIPVCLIDNGPFTAAGICYSEREFKEFAAPDATPDEIAEAKQRVEVDGAAFFSLDSGRQRLRIWYYVPIERIIAVEPSVEAML